jgi:hypothetical protein
MTIRAINGRTSIHSVFCGTNNGVMRYEGYCLTVHPGTSYFSIELIDHNDMCSGQCIARSAAGSLCSNGSRLSLKLEAINGANEVGFSYL